MVPPTAREESDHSPSSSDTDDPQYAPPPSDRQTSSPRRDRRRSRSQRPRQYHQTSPSFSTTDSDDQGGGRHQGEFPLSPSLVPFAYGSGPQGQWNADDRLPVFTASPMSTGGRPNRRHLIDFVKNEWMTDSMYGQKFSSSSDRHEPSWLEMIRAPRLRRYTLLYTALVLSLILGFRWLEPRVFEYTDLSRSLRVNVDSVNGVYGVNQRPQFKGMMHVKELEEELLPGKEAAGGALGQKRLVIVGDVHGCKDELSKLLDKVSFNPSTDHLITAGDMITKGPDSLEVIDMLSEMGASCVRGNHEDRVLLIHRQLHLPHIDLAGPDENLNRTTDDLEEESYSHGDYKDRALAAQLNAKQLDYLSQCPVILKVGGVDQLGEVVVVHAGLAAGVALHNQDPYTVMNMRTIDLETHVPSENRKGTAWFKLWNRYQARLPKAERSTVIYGHDAKRGLSIEKYSKGLDSGCLRGGELTAFVIDGSPEGTVSSELVSVKCENHMKRQADGPTLGKKKDDKEHKRER